MQITFKEKLELKDKKIEELVDDDDENDKLCYKFVSFVQIILHLDFQCEYERIIS